jgi:hypothetical protein
MSQRLIILLSCLILSGAGDVAAADDARAVLDRVAERYVKLVLAVGQHDADYVDAYYGPPGWASEAKERGKRPLSSLRREGQTLVAELGRVDFARGADADLILRRSYLHGQLGALIAHTARLGGRRLGFDQEARLVYDAAPPRHDAAHFQTALDRLAVALPGEGPLAARYAAFRARFVIPRERLDAVFRAAVDESRRRSLPHVTLPAGERFSIEYVTDKPWSGYNWYKGAGESLIQVNTSLPIHIDRALDLAAHEGYPGHHVYNALLEQHLARGKGWVEFTVYPLFSPQSLIAEGTANFGIEVAFPGAERLAFERDVLFPLAGLDPAEAARYTEVRELMRGLSYADNEAARGLIDGTMAEAEALAWLETYALMPPERAQQRVRFIRTYRAYVINYNLGLDLVRAYVEARGGTAADPARRWAVFVDLLASPRLPSALTAPAR